MNEKQPAIYFLSNKKDGSIYTGVTSNLIKRVYDHKYADTNGYTKKYNCKKLVYFEIYDDMYEAIKREKRLKNYLRDWKIELIERDNPDWNDLYDTIA